ncbi:AMP-dependent synthetase/ligase [Thiohalomonas denitrificans]|uniref:Long-chain acyl-CoA synthetase n=1 Tax=Thiohalomonas denitrificans TaxID=415747 RepID=A0A1G5Q989_9GAMM|nr:long-chain fatty acid--CoA ligase [Thiohalomonas denitrificans]SCZ58413.1 long-chain acyl-CoA synthetase [Thiohalomonas denitrificans]
MTAQATEKLLEPSAPTLDGLFRARAERSPERPAYRWYDRATAEWREITWGETGAEVARWRAALAAEGLVSGERVAVAQRNGVQWILFEQAALSLGLVVVPLYPDDRPDSLAWQLKDSGARLLLLQDAGRWHRLQPALEEVTQLVRVVIPGSERVTDQRATALDEWLPAVGNVPPAPVHSDDLATLVYTSGTYGRPKGVMLSHRNILSNVRAALEQIDVYPSDRFLSFLPLAHMLERTGGYYLPMAAGACVAFARSVAQLSMDFASQRPTAVIAVPRIFETAYGRITQRLADGPRWRRTLFDTAVRVGWRRFKYRQGCAAWHPSLLAGPLLRRLVGRPVLERLGGRLRIAVSGGAALSPELARTFIGLGLDLCQGYGLTEASPVVTFNPPGNNRPESIGVLLPGWEARFDSGGELLVRGPSVMRGYWRNPKATAEAIDRAGWLHTGDLGEQRGDHFYLTGRRKEILVLSNGENVPPAALEGAIALDPLFEQVMVVGEGRPFLSALVVVNGEVWGQVAERFELPADATGLMQSAAREEMLRRIAERLHAFPAYAKVRQVYATLDGWSIESGLLTPTLKVRRNAVFSRYAEEIARLYQAKR